MNESNPRIGDWVSFYSDLDHRGLLGYIVNRIPRTQNYAVFVPSTKRYYSCPVATLVTEDLTIKPVDIRTLIDIALDLRDEAWFLELTNILRQDSCVIGESVP